MSGGQKLQLINRERCFFFLVLTKGLSTYVDKGSGNNNTRSEILEYEENPLRNADASVSLGVNRKSCALIGNKHSGQTRPYELNGLNVLTKQRSC